MRGIFLAIAVLISSVALAQEKVVAVLMQLNATSKPATRAIQKSFLAQVAEQEGLFHMVYTTSGAELKFLPEMSSDSIERAADYLLRYEIEIFENYKPKLNTSTEGVKSFTVSSMATVQATLVDLHTNEVVGALSKQLKDATGETSGTSVSTTKTFTVDWDKHAKGAKSQKAAMAKVHKAYKPKLESYMKSKREIINALLYSVELGYLMPPYLEVHDVGLKDDKAKELFVTSPYKAKLSRHTYVRVFKVDTIDGFLVPEAIGSYYVKEQNGNDLRLTSGLGSKSKEVGSVYLSGQKLHVSFKSEGYSGPAAGINSIDRVKVAVRAEGIKMDPLVGGMSKLVRVRLINDSEDAITEKFRELYKQERFIDSRKESALVGADYIISSKGDNYSISSVESAELLFNYAKSDGVKGFIEAAMVMTGLEMEVAEVTKQTKNKVKKILIHSPWGFDKYTHLNIYVLEEENVGGQLRERRVQIGECVSYRAGGMYSEFSLKDGESELFSALQDGKKVIFRYREFKFLGNSWK